VTSTDLAQLVYNLFSVEMWDINDSFEARISPKHLHLHKLTCSKIYRKKRHGVMDNEINVSVPVLNFLGATHFPGTMAISFQL